MFNNAGLLQLMHPRERREVWRKALERVTTPQVKTKASKRAVRKDCKMLQREAKGRAREAAKQRLRNLSDAADTAAARASLIPEAGKKRKRKEGAHNKGKA